MSTKKFMVDPPSGWMFGFPKECSREVWGDSDKYRELLVSSGYPEDQLELALNYSRVWEVYEDE